MIDVELALTLAEQLVSAIIKIAPSVQKGVTDAEPYIQALAGMLTGSNATQAQVDALLVQLDADSADFQTPLPDETP